MKTENGLSWTNSISCLTIKEKDRLKNMLIDATIFYKAKWMKNNPSKVEKYNKNGIAFYNYLKRNKDIEFRGFVPILRYIKAKGTEDEMFGQFNHPWGIPAMVFASKTMPFTLVTSPVLRIDDSIINEIEDNKENHVEALGYTG